MATFSITLTGWEDGERVTRTLLEPDRWQVHTADTLTVTFDDITVDIVQQPQSISAKRMGVGAVLWDGSMAMAAHLVMQPRHRFIGMRCVEMGAGVGLTGLVLAKMGAKVVLTDKDAVLPLLRQNASLNGFDPDTPPRQAGPSATVQALEWGAPGSDSAIRALALGPRIDLVVAADVCYVDQDGVSPSSAAFVDACAALCGPTTRVLLAQELRFSAVRDQFVAAARKRFGQVSKLPPSAIPAAFRVEHMELYEMSL